MNSIPLVRANAILPLIKFLDQNGCPSERFLKQAKLPIATLENPETLIPLHSGFTFSELVARQEGIELFGVLAAQQARIEDFGLFAKVACQSLTLYDFLHTIVTLLTKTHNSGAKVWLTQENDRVWFNHQYTQSVNLDNHQAQYYACCLYVQIIQQVTGSRWHPTDLHFQARQLRGLENIELFSQVQLQFNRPNNAIGFAKTLLSLPIKQSMAVHPSNLQQDYETLVALGPKPDFVGSLKQLVRSHLPDGGLPITLAAEAANLSARTLQRRLAEDGLSYSRLVDQIRFQLALDLLKDPSIQLMDVALELGYTEPATFTRSFQRWTGTSPREFRRLHLQPSLKY